MSPPTARATRAPAEPRRREMLADALAGLTQPRKRLACKYFYDERGSALFEAITELPEYYLTRAEVEILEREAAAIAGYADPRPVVVEFGSGSARKSRLLLAALRAPAAYVPIDIDADMLAASADALKAEFPSLAVWPVAGDFMRLAGLPAGVPGGRRLGFFPGSTIGNLDPADALAFLTRTRALLGRGGALLIGVDLKKSEDVLLAAYDDAAGVTAAFNRNILVHLNRTLGADFDVEAFDHRARYDADRGRIEMHLVSRKRQAVAVGGRTIAFAAGESIHTENSYKYAVAEFRLLARAAGWEPRRAWLDDGERFSLHWLDASA